MEKIGSPLHWRSCSTGNRSGSESFAQGRLAEWHGCCSHHRLHSLILGHATRALTAAAYAH
eukprot:4111331-Amphidinium_carterae.1